MNFLDYISFFTIYDFLDIVIVSVLLYKLITLMRNTTAVRLLKGIFFIILIMWISAERFKVVHFIMSSIMQIGSFAIVVVFQPELRRILEQFGKATFSIFKSKNADEESTKLMVMQIVEAVSAMAWTKTGALIVFETEDSLDHISATGTTINADVTAELVKNVFYPKAPLHDGAVVVKNLRLNAAGCILPLSAKFDISKDLGTRHRAALGMSESCDCCVVVVSEETGAISFAKGGMLKRHLAPETLERLLLQELLSTSDEETGDSKNIISWVREAFKK